MPNEWMREKGHGMTARQDWESGRKARRESPHKKVLHFLYFWASIRENHRALEVIVCFSFPSNPSLLSGSADSGIDHRQFWEVISSMRIIINALNHTS